MLFVDATSVVNHDGCDVVVAATFNVAVLSAASCFILSPHLSPPLGLTLLLLIPLILR